MRIAHFAPFAPTRCGLYEAARDFVIADRLHGRESVIIDTGVTVDGVGHKRNVGQIDVRGGEVIVAEDYSAALDADVLVLHGIPPHESGILAQTDAPVIIVLHGRPEACFLNEQAFEGKAFSYSYFESAAKFPRTKLMVSMWKEHLPYWGMFVPPEKLRLLPHPPIDTQRFSPKGKTHEFSDEQRGNFNVLIAESWRKDVNIFDAVHGCAVAAERMPGQIKIHICAIDPNTEGACWPMWRHLERLGALGERSGRRSPIEEYYRAMDLVVSPQRICTRSVGEPLCCGVPVVAQRGNRYTDYTADFADPMALGAEIVRALKSVRRGKAIVDDSPFDRVEFGGRLGTLYAEVTGGVLEAVG